MVDILTGLFDTSGFPARWDCGVWSSELGWLHIYSDLAICGVHGHPVTNRTSLRNHAAPPIADL